MINKQKILGLRQERKKAFDKGTEYLERAKDGVMSAEDRSAYEAVMEDFDRLSGEIEALEAHEERAARMGSFDDDPGGEAHKPNPGEERGDEGKAEYRKVFEKALRHGMVSLNREERKILETRAMAEGTTTAGGHLVPDVLDKKFLEHLANISVMMKLGTEIATSGGDHEIPIADGQGTFYWTGESESYTDSSPTIDKKTLSAYKGTFLVKISEELVADSAFDIFNHLAVCYANVAGDAIESRLISGTGSSQISGVATGAAAGITAAAAAAITTDELLNLKSSVKAKYWRQPKAGYLMSPSTMMAVRKLKNSNGQYLWQPSLTVGAPDSFDGNAVYVSDQMPSMEAAAVPVLFGDFSYYWIGKRGSRAMQILNELYAENGQIGFRVYERLDGVLTRSEAVKKLTMAAA